jgi:hypothetical protein
MQIYHLATLPRKQEQKGVQWKKRSWTNVPRCTAVKWGNFELNLANKV